MPPLRAVTLDLWQTLMADAPDVEQERREWRLQAVGDVLARAGFPQAPEPLRAAYQASWVECEALWTRGDDLDVPLQVRALLRALDPSLPARLSPASLHALAEAYGRAVIEVPPALFSGVPQLLRTLERRGYRLGLICNTGRSPGSALRVVMDELGILRYFWTTTFSNEVGFRKPRREIFEITLRNLGVDPAAACHVGDTFASDIRGAKASGMRAIYVGPQETRESDVCADAEVRSLDELPAALEALEAG